MGKHVVGCVDLMHKLEKDSDTRVYTIGGLD